MVKAQKEPFLDSQDETETKSLVRVNWVGDGSKLTGCFCRWNSAIREIFAVAACGGVVVENVFGRTS